MRFSQFKEGAMEDVERIMQKTFSPERKAVQAEVLRLARAVEMGKDDKVMLARAITELTKSELEVKRSDPDLKVSTEQNINILKRAMNKLTGIAEDIAEGTPYDDEDEMSPEEEAFVDMVVDYYRGEGYVGNPTTDHMDSYDHERMADAYDIAGGDPSDTVGRGNFLHREITQRLGLNEDGTIIRSKRGIGSLRNRSAYDGLSKIKNIELDKKDAPKKAVGESLTEAEFDEAAGEKDACYRKVKSRYKVWPSAYASGALVKCRKVGAANWGNSKKK